MNKYILNDKEEEKMERQGLMKKNLAVILALVMIFTCLFPQQREGHMRLRTLSSA